MRDVQSRAERSQLSRIIAGNNILNALFMVVASVLSGVLLNVAHLSIPQLFLCAALMNAVVAIYIYTLVPEFLLRFVDWILINTLYRILLGEQRGPRFGSFAAIYGIAETRMLIAKALSHEPRVLFLDEPSAGVDVALRKDMWAMVRTLRESGVTIVLTTHYIEEAEDMADRVGVISHGKIVLVEDKAKLMQKLGKRRLTLVLQLPMETIPAELSDWALELKDNGQRLSYSFDANAETTGIPQLLNRLSEMRIDFKDLETTRSSLEDIFVKLLEDAA